jgi:hypothetical protein
LQTILEFWARHRSLLLAISLVTFGNLALTLPTVSKVVHLPHDVVGYVSTARNWIEGRGFVDPVLYSYYLDGASAPIPAIAVRPPIISILFSIPMKLGLGLVGIGILHAIWSVAIASSILLLARRFMSLPAATAAAIGVAGSHGWRSASNHLLTESTSVGALLLLFAIAPRCLRTRPGGVVLALVTLIAWLVRPNLGAFVAVVVAAAVIQWGFWGAFRSKPLWTYVLTFAFLQQACAFTLGAIFGYPPYAHYGVMAETLSMYDVLSYQAEYSGAMSFAAAHGSEITSNLLENIQDTFERFFLMPTFLYVGWVGLPGLAYVLIRRKKATFLSVLCGVGGVAFAAIAILTGWSFSGIRYPLLSAVCFWLCGMAACDWAMNWLGTRRSPPGSRFLPALPLTVLLCAFFVATPSNQIRAIFTQPLNFDRARPQLQSGGKWNAISRSLCQYIPDDAIVTSTSPWNLHYWCGNAGHLIPDDLTDLKWLHAYLDDIRPGYIIAKEEMYFSLFNDSPRLKLLEISGTVALYEVKHPGSDARRWDSPGPLKDLMPPPRSYY